ncbi:MAG: hypothetical protein AAFV93_16285 [Chloroflexota bacterium]
MQTLNLLTDEIGTLDDARLIINDFHWFLTVDEIAGQWTVKAGETTILTADSQEAVDAFLYGMALAYKGLPAHLYAKLFSMMAGDNIVVDESSVELDISDTDDDERLSDFDLQNYEPSEDTPSDDRFSFD